MCCCCQRSLLGNIFKLNRWRKKKENEQPQWWLLIVHLIKYLDFLGITLEYENEPSLKVFQEAMIHSCVEVVVREMQRQCRTLRVSAASIADDISLLNWVHHFAIQSLKKNGRRWRKTMVQFGEESV